jgi:hypothetical protein
MVYMPSERATASTCRQVLPSARCRAIGRGKEIAMDFPFAVLPPKNEKLIISLFNRRFLGQNFGLAGRRRSDVSQIAHLNDFMNRENDVEFQGLENVIVAGFHRIPAAECTRILSHKNRILTVQCECGRSVARIERFFVSFNDADDILVHGYVLGCRF